MTVYVDSLMLFYLELLFVFRFCHLKTKKINGGWGFLLSEDSVWSLSSRLILFTRGNGVNPNIGSVTAWCFYSQTSFRKRRLARRENYLYWLKTTNTKCSHHKCGLTAHLSLTYATCQSTNDLASKLGQ